MSRLNKTCLFVIFLVSTGLSQVEFVGENRQIDVLIHGNLFTSYRFADDQPKPLLVPVQTPSGIQINRRYPLTQIAGGSEDHPHHIGLFFAVDRVNGTNFWKNSTLSPQIKHVSIDEVKGGRENGTISAASEWIDEKGVAVLRETRTMIFSGDDIQDILYHHSDILPIMGVDQVVDDGVDFQNFFSGKVRPVFHGVIPSV